MADREARIRITAKDDTASGIQKAKAQLAGLAREAESIGSSFRGLGASLAVALPATLGVGLFRNLVDGLDKLNDLKDATGASIENLSALEDVADRTGTSFETVGASLTKFNAALTNAKPGSDLERVFTSLGLSVKELQAQDPAEALRRVAVAFSGFADDGNKARVAQELFGRSIKEVAPFLADLAKQGKLNATVTTEQAEAAERFNQQLFALSASAKAFGRSLVNDLLPPLTTFFERLNGIKNAGGFFSSIGKEFNANIISDKLRVVVGEIERLDAYMQKNPGNMGLELRMAQLREEAASLSRQASAASQALKGFSDVAKPLPALDYGNEGRNRPRPALRAPALPSVPSRPKTERKDEIDQASQALAAYVRQLENERQKVSDLSDEQKALNFLRTLGSTGEIPQVRELVLGLASQNDELEDQLKWRKLNAQAVEEMQKAEQALNDQINEFSGRTSDALKQRLTAQLEKRLAGGEAFSAEELDRIVRGIGGINDELQETKNIGDELGLSFASAFENAIVGGQGLRELLSGLEQDILRIVTRKAVTEPLANSITNFIKPVTGAGGGFDFGSIFGNIGKFLGIPSYAVGTDYVPRDTLAFLHRGERVETARENARGSGARPVTIVQNFSAPVDRRTQSQVAAMAAMGLSRAQRNL